MLDVDVTEDLKVNPVDFDILPYPELVKYIQIRFNVLNRQIDRVVKGSLRAFIISGTPGLGKSYGTEQKLEAAAAAGKIRYVKVKGTMSNIGLYMKLYECRDENTVLLIDDADGIYKDVNALNTLKAALDSSPVRQINYNKISAALNKAKIPMSFEYKGRCIFITNEDFQHHVEKKTALSVHFGALLSRSTYLDLGIHGMRAVFARIVQLVVSTNVVTKFGCTEAQVVQMLNWVRANLNNLHELSIRTVERLASSMMDEPDTWEETAQVTLLKTVRVG